MSVWLENKHFDVIRSVGRVPWQRVCGGGLEWSVEVSEDLDRAQWPLATSRSSGKLGRRAITVQYYSM